MAARTVVVDDRRYATLFDGFDRPLVARSSCGQERVLEPWTWRRHRQALRDCTRLAGDSLALAANEFAAQVLGREQQGAAFDAFAPLALWWAAGGGEDSEPLPNSDGWCEAGAVRVRLRAWHESERLSALGAALAGRPGEGGRFDAVGYLDAMLRASIAAVEPERDTDDLDSGSFARLLPQVLALNVGDVGEMRVLHGGAAQEAARGTLAVCRLLGWTPSQVWAAPAAEVSRLLQLAAIAEGPPIAEPVGAPGGDARRHGVAGHPDAVVFRFE